MNIAMLLEMAAEGDPGRVVLGSHAGGITASDLLDRSRRAALYFQKSGAEVVGYFGLNSDALPVALFGAALAGLPFSPINYRAPDEQLTGILARVAGGLMIADDDEVARLGACGATTVVTKGEFAAAVDELGGDAAAGAGAEFAFVDPEEVGVLLFTSGTTSEPKAAVLRHRHLVSYIITSVEFLGCGPDEAQLICVPPYHIAGIAAVLSSLYAGRRIMYLPTFDADEWVRIAVAEHITHAMVVPTMLGRILDAAESSGVTLDSLRHLSYGGGRMPLELVERTLRDMPHVDLVNAYGLTETSSTIAMLTPDDHREAFGSEDPAVRGRLASVGRPLPALEVEVRGEDDEVLPAGEKGEIWVRGEQVAGEYVGRSVLTDDGWFRTRDAGWFDADGFVYVDGRLDDVIVRGSENLSPGEIEDVLMLHPAVAEAAVIGIPDTEWGEAVAAVVVLHPDGSVDEGELQVWVRERLRSTKMPGIIDFRDELPYSPTGKLLRRVLRDELSEGRDTV
ncbi:MAG TPA: class I adenylate-forming enzyme family protein [Acidimicrobiales bacterium]|nr:class I adenylate-forming enzyme family protein [Acidimicrobiales bacterium]